MELLERDTKLAKEIKQDFKPASTLELSNTTKILSFISAPRQLSGALSLVATSLSGLSFPATIGFMASAIATHSLLTKMIFGGNTLRAATFLEVEHLSRLQVVGGLPSMILPLVINALNSISTNNAVVAKNALLNLLSYENHFSYLGIGNHFLIKDLLRHIKELNPQQIIVFPLSYMNGDGGHIILGSLQRTNNDKYILRIHNGGEGLEFHYHRYENKTGREIFQTTLEFVDIDFCELERFIPEAASIHACKLNNNAKKLYKLFLMFKSNVMPPSEDPRLWMRMQIGPSCSGYAIKCFLKFILSPSEYKQFSHNLLDLAINNLDEDFQRSWLYQTDNHNLVREELYAKRARIFKMPTETVEKKVTLLSNVGRKIEKKIWGLFFPLSALVSSPTGHLGCDDDSFEMMGHLPYFKSLTESFAQIDANKNYISIQHQHLSGITNRIKPSLRNIINFRIIFETFFKELPMHLYTSQEQKKMHDIRLDLIQRTEDFRGYQLYSLYKIVFKKFKFNIRESLANDLMQVVHHLKKNNFCGARQVLNNIYLSFNNIPKELPLSQREDYIYVICQTLYLEDSVKLDDIEIRGGLSMIFLKMGLELPQFLNKHLSMYRDWRLDKSFPDSPWRQAILDYNESRSINRCAFQTEMPNKLLIRQR